MKEHLLPLGAAPVSKKSKIKDRFSSMRGHVYFEVRDAEGNLLQVVDDPNLIVNGGKQNMALLLSGAVTNRFISQIGFGEGTSAPLVTDSGLSNVLMKFISSWDQPTTNSIRFNWVLTVAEANGKPISELGLFTQAGVMVARKTFDTINKSASISLSGSWTLIF